MNLCVHSTKPFPLHHACFVVACCKRFSRAFKILPQILHRQRLGKNARLPCSRIQLAPCRSAEKDVCMGSARTSVLCRAFCVFTVTGPNRTHDRHVGDSCLHALNGSDAPGHAFSFHDDPSSVLFVTCLHKNMKNPWRGHMHALQSRLSCAQNVRKLCCFPLSCCNASFWS